MGIGMLEKYTLVAYGVGKSFFPYIERIDKLAKVEYFCDSNEGMWGRRIYNDGRCCISPEELLKLPNPYVIITVDKSEYIEGIGRLCGKNGIKYDTAETFIEKFGKECHEYGSAAENSPFGRDIENSDALSIADSYWLRGMHDNKIHKFIDFDLRGTTTCNFKCEYCYVWRKEDFRAGRKTSEHTPKEIREALSLERLGGRCFINMCARGETMLSEDIVELAYELLKEGHYVSIVTNGTVTGKINEILQFPEELQERMFFKISFHFKELKRRNLFETFWNNICAISRSKCSYTLEVTPGDGSVEYIDELKNMVKDIPYAALPHISFTRDSNKKGLDLLSDYSLEEYRNIWGSFDSKMFELKSEWYGKKIENFCYAGNWSYLINILNGDIRACYRQDVIGNIFDKSMKQFPTKPIGHDCHMEYCFNNHAFLAWGCVPDIKCYNYLDMRNRVDNVGKYWVKQPMYEAMQNKLYDNNFRYDISWSEYERLFDENRKPGFVVFNSPDYSNLGDHAIAYATRQFLESVFREDFGEHYGEACADSVEKALESNFDGREVIEIACEQYVKEYMKIKNAITKEDVLIIAGGGYMGSLWLRMEDVVKHIVQQYPDNKIIVFPQTIYFSDSKLGAWERESLKSIFNSHRDITFIAREEKSFNTAREIFDDNVRVYMLPDMAFAIDYEGRGRRTGALLCMRSDKENCNYNIGKIEKILSDGFGEAEHIDTILKEQVNYNNRWEKLKAVLDKIGGARLVVTDRLHCMIFCAITKTPCIVLDNVSGKVSGVYKWIDGLSYILKAESEEDICDKVSQLACNGDDKAGISNEANETDEGVLKNVRENFKVLADVVKDVVSD